MMIRALVFFSLIIGTSLISSCAPNKALETSNSFFMGTEEIAEKLSGKTIRTSSHAHGSQYEYFSPDGRTYLWYPSNRRIVQGEWKSGFTRICFRYGPNTYNPVTKQDGGKWDCRKFWRWSLVVKDRFDGDPFGLAESPLVPCLRELDDRKGPNIQRICKFLESK